MLGTNLKISMDYYHGYDSGTTKTIKSKPVQYFELEDVDYKTTQFPVGTKFLRFSTMCNTKGQSQDMIIRENFIIYYIKMEMLKISIIMK